MNAVETQSIENPHETRPFQAHGHMDVVTLGDFTLGKGTFEPGWRWSVDVKPIAGTESCQVLHTGLCLSGSMTIRMNDGTEATIVPATSSASSPVTTPGSTAMSPASFSTLAWPATPSPELIWAAPHDWPCPNRPLHPVTAGPPLDVVDAGGLVGLGELDKLGVVVEWALWHERFAIPWAGYNPHMTRGMSRDDRRRDSSPARGYAWAPRRGRTYVICDRCAAVVSLDASPTSRPQGAGIAVHNEWHDLLDRAANPPLG